MFRLDIGNGWDWNARARDGSSVNDLQAWDLHRHRTPDLSHSLQSCGRPFGLARA